MRKLPKSFVSPLDPFLIIKWFLFVFSVWFKFVGKRLTLILFGISAVVMFFVMLADSV